MKHLLILVILVVFANEAAAQKPWKWMQLNGPNVGNHTAQILTGTKGEIISVGNTGYYSTMNDGLSWDYHQIITHANCQSATYAQSGLLISSSGEYYFFYDVCDSSDQAVAGVYRSMDQGSTWTHILKNKNVYGMVESSMKSLIISAQGDPNSGAYYIFESIDNGNSWTEIANYYGYPLKAATEKFIYFSYFNQPYCFQYSLALKTLQTIFNGNSGDTSDFVLLNDNLILLFDNSAFLISDGSPKWDTVAKLHGIKGISLGNGGLVYSIVQPDKNLSIASSSDQGRNWTTVANVSVYHPGDKYTINYQNPDMILYENDTALYLSRDRGSSWKQIGLPFDSVNKVVVADDGRIFTEPVDRFDALQYIYNYFDAQLSSDKGVTWYKSEPAKVRITGIGKGINNSIIAIAPDSNESLNSVWLFDSALRTQWQKQSAVQHVAAHPLIATDGSKSTYIATNNYYSEPTIYRSDDNAFSWIDIDAPNTSNDIYSLDASTDGTIYFGSYPIMYRSDDRGTTWIKLIPTHDIVKLTYIKTFGTTGVLLGTEGDGLLLSNDKGNSWARLDGKNFDTVTCIAINSKGEIAAGTNRGLWISDTSKHNWSKVMLGHDANLYIGGIDVAQNDDFYVGTYGSSVWKGTRNYNAVKYSPSNNSTMQVSPNPTNGKVIVTLTGQSNEQIRLELYDILGRRVKVLVDGRYSGEKEISFNTSDLSNGIYTLILSGTQNETQKIVVQH